MNELGMTLAWSAAQITFVLVPAAFLHALASRRSVVAGSWMATAGLALSLAIGAATFIPWPRAKSTPPAASMAVDASARTFDLYSGKKTEDPVRAGASPAHDTGRLAVNLSRAIATFLDAWRRLEPGPLVPVTRLRPWGSALAAVVMAGAGVGLFRLFLGLWAVELCRRRGTILNEPALARLCDEIQRAMGCDQRIEIRQVPGLTAPATAGWWHPVIMLPDDWRLWDDADRRAVLAHELAHIHRWDYAAGLIARLAVALQFYHPLVHWMARRLQLQQELAADAVGARFAGGRGLYLLTLSRLALKQDERSPSWPARAFLPARGTLIRRITMLQDETMTADRPWSRSRRLLAGLCLLAAALGAAMLRGPARAHENGKDANALKAASPGSREASQHGTTPFDLRYVSDETEGMIAFRPAAALRRTGISGVTLLSLVVGDDVSEVMKELKIEPPAPGGPQLALEDIDWAITGLHFGRAKPRSGARAMHRIELPRLVLRTIEPFDWLGFLRHWRLDLAEMRQGRHIYVKITGQVKAYLGSNPCVYLPDDRTIVLDEEAAIQKMLRRDKPVVPAHLAGPDWDRFSRGILAVAINNRDGKLAKSYDLGRPDDAVVLSLFNGVDRWILGADDTDAITLHATAVCNDNASATIAHTVESLVTTARNALEHPEKGATPSEHQARGLRMVKALLANLRVGHGNHSVDLHSEGFGTIAEFGSIIEALFRELVEMIGGNRP